MIQQRKKISHYVLTASITLSIFAACSSKKEANPDKAKTR